MSDGAAREAELRRARHTIMWALGISVAGSVGLLIAYWGDAGTQAEGIGLAVAMAGLALAAGVWGKKAVPDRIAVEHRPRMASSPSARAGVRETAELDEVGVGRRRSLFAMLGVAGAALLAALASPFRSLGPSPFPERRTTGWHAGRRLVDSDGVPIHVDDLDVDSIATAFPDGQKGNKQARALSQVILIRTAPGSLHLSTDRSQWTPEGYIAYSKVCTHAGCPVALYDATESSLLCPCHQSVFKVSEGAKPVFGPAARSLPQLPLDIDDQGYLIAKGDFSEPVGPSYWSQP